jgi:hypothetical protein
MRKAFWLMAVILLVGIGRSPADDMDESADVDQLMQAKLKHSQSILTGLVNKDFDSISAGAEYLRRLGKLERWTKAFTPEYKEQLQVFNSANQKLIRMAKEQNLEGATLAYTQLTVSCVQCHQLTRQPAE